jgi:PKD repeat protein
MFLVASSVMIATALVSETYAVNDGCIELKIIFARGSGQTLQEDEYVKFRDQLKARLSVGEESFYELGTQRHGSFKYEAVDIETLDNLGGAFFSAGMANDYGRSVDSGVNELKAYLSNLYINCPETKIVLGGYSQGAQVMGQTLEGLSPEMRDNIAFVALFGDPKLFLPEGVSGDVFNLPPACTDSRTASLWRRDIGNCLIAHGSLGPRFPYLPGDLEQKVGAWCVGGDWICGGLENINFNSSSAHPEDYPKQDGPIDQAAYEIAVRLKKEGFITNVLPELDDKYVIPPAVMFMIDGTTINERTHFLAIEQPILETAAQKVLNMDGGAGLWMYGPKCPAVTSIADLDISYFIVSEDLLGRCNILDTKLPGSTLNRAIEESRARSFNVRPQAPKIFIVLSDKLYSKQAILATYRKTGHVADNFYIYPIVPDDVKASYEDLKVDGGQTVILDDYDVDKLINSHTLHPQVKPIFDSPDYKALPGQTITFSAEKSIIHDDEIVEYRWDFGDGSSFASTEPIAEHVYSMIFRGSVRLTVLTKNGLQQSATANVTIQEKSAFLLPLDAPKNLRVHAMSRNSARLTWAQNKQADRWLITLGGIPLGYTDKNTILIADVEYQHDNIFAVYGITHEGEIGEKAEVVLSAEIARVSNDHNMRSTTNSGNSSTYANIGGVGNLSTSWNQAQRDILGAMNFFDTHTYDSEISSGERSSGAIDVLFVLGAISLLGGGVVIWAKTRHKKE